MLPQRIGRVVVAALVLLGTFGCERPPPPPPPKGIPAVRVASLVPAVTNLLLGVGAGEKLVAVSNYDTDPSVGNLPRVGDLLSVDWEQLAAARPTLMVVQINPDKLPPGLSQRAADLGIELVNVRLNALSDIAETLVTLQAKIDPNQDVTPWARRFKARLDAVRARVAKMPKVPALLALNADATFVAGRGGYLDELLALAGGENVLPPDSPPYPTLDRERLSTLRPAKVVMLLPAAGDATLAQARQFGQSLPPRWSATAQDVTRITDAYALVPGWSVLDLADALARALHPSE